MNKKEGTIIILLIAIILISGFSLIGKPNVQVVSPESENNNILSVTGTAEIYEKPDIAYITIGVQTENKAFTQAQQQNKDRMNQILNLLKEFNIDEKEIKTIEYQVYPDYRYDPKTNSRELRAYVVRNRLEVTVKNLDILGSLIDKTGNNAANIIENIRFDITNEQAIKIKALEKALLDSKEKASRMLAVYDIKKMSPINIQENYQKFYNGPIYNQSMETEKVLDSSTPVSPGEMRVSATVSVKYHY